MLPSKTWALFDLILGRYSRWVMKLENSILKALVCLLAKLLGRKSMFAQLHSDIHALKSGLFHLTDQPNSQKGRAAKVKDRIISET